MTEILKAALFGIVEGVTEWLPVSSTGHLILLDALVPLELSRGFGSFFEVAVQLGAAAAVVVLFSRRLNPLDPSNLRLWGLVLAAVLPSGAVGALTDGWMEENLHRPAVVGVCLIAYGVFFLLAERRRTPPRITRAEDTDLSTALGIGLFQCLSLVPGTSRSGATVLGGLLLGVSRTAAAEFSFLMALPTMLGACLFRGGKLVLAGTVFTGTETAALLTGCAVSFSVSLLVIRALLDYVRTHTFAPFARYRMALGAAVLLTRLTGRS